MEIEKELNDNEMIVSAANKQGIITYANKEFSKLSEYKIDELYGQPHNIIRHPDMPRAIFKYLWEQLLLKEPVISYVKNHTKDKKKHYWVKAMLYPIVENGKIKQISSYRTKPTKYSIKQIDKIYTIINEYEKDHGLEKSYDFFQTFLKDRNLTYKQCINRLNENKQVLNKELLNIDVKRLKIDHLLFISSIISTVQKDMADESMAFPKNCEFCKKMNTLEGEEFAKDNKFEKIKDIHHQIHNSMKSYFQSNANQREMILKSVYKDVEKLFETMIDLIDTYEVI